MHQLLTCRLHTLIFPAAHCRKDRSAMVGPSSLSMRSSLRFKTAARIFFHSGLFAPPPQILERSIRMPRLRATSRESLRPTLRLLTPPASYLPVWCPSTFQGTWLSHPGRCAESAPHQIRQEKIPVFSQIFNLFLLPRILKSSSLKSHPSTTCCRMPPEHTPHQMITAIRVIKECRHCVRPQTFSLEIKSVPLVPSDRLHLPSPTVPVPTAAAALSPAPAMIFTSGESPSSSAISGFKVPTTS